MKESNKTFMSQRLTMHDQLQKPGIRFATQYQLSFNDQENMGHLELVRMREKYKWKCEELDNLKTEMQMKSKSLQERSLVRYLLILEKINKGEQDLRKLTQHIQDKLTQLATKEEQIQQKFQNYEEKYKDRELAINLKITQQLEKEQQLQQLEQQLQIRSQVLTEKEELLSRKISDQESWMERYQIKETCMKEKENYYHLQIDKMNMALESILAHEHTIKNIEFRLGQQLQSLKDTEQQLIYQLQNCRTQEELIEQRDKQIQYSEELINRKLDWDMKNNNTTMRLQNTESEISRFTYSGLLQRL